MREFYRSPAFAPFVLSFVFVAALAIYYGSILPVGSIQFGDEYIVDQRFATFGPFLQACCDVRGRKF